MQTFTVDLVGLAERLAATWRTPATEALSDKLGQTVICNILSEIGCAIWQALNIQYLKLQDGTKKWKDVVSDFCSVELFKMS